MNIKAVRNDADLAAALARVDQLWGAPVDTPDGNELDHLVAMIEKYEGEHYPMPASNPADAIEFLKDQRGVKSSA
ncbi:transcriptional regulator [Pseudomonas sp. zjy_15]|uniref:transcriptional regulator n=1 Tax=unclassified Pseudomonas TaxID=196821 RepID=UPI003709CD80